MRSQLVLAPVAPPVPDRHAAGDLIAGRYQLTRPAGRGAMATVWAARDVRTGRELAIKLPRASTYSDEASRERFVLEARIAGRLRHPNVVEVVDAGSLEGGGTYLAMELLQGETLAQRIARSVLSAREALYVARGIALGLSAAHEAGVIHRDVKPENVFLARPTGRATRGDDRHDFEFDYVPKLLDFGISKPEQSMGLTHDGRMLGTPAYMSPEQALGQTDIDHRSDIFSVGVVMYEMLMGELPFAAASYQALLPRIAEKPHAPLPRSVPEPVRLVVDACLEKSRSRRTSSANSLVRRIDHALLDLESWHENARREAQRARQLRASGRIFDGELSIRSSAVTHDPGGESSRAKLARSIGSAASVCVIVAGLTWMSVRRLSAPSASAHAAQQNAHEATPPAAPRAAPRPAAPLPPVAPAIASSSPSTVLAAPAVVPASSASLIAPRWRRPASSASARPSASATTRPVTLVDTAGF